MAACRASASLAGTNELNLQVPSSVFVQPKDVTESPHAIADVAMAIKEMARNNHEARIMLLGGWFDHLKWKQDGTERFHAITMTRATLQ